MEEIKRKLLLTREQLPQKFNWPSRQRMQKAVEMYEHVIAEIPDDIGQLRVQCSSNLGAIKQIVEIGLSSPSWKQAKILLHQARCSMDDQINIILNSIELQHAKVDKV